MFNLRYLSGQGPSHHHALKLTNSTNPWFNALVQPSFILIVLWIRVRHQCEWMIVNGFSQNLLRLQNIIQTCKQSYGHGNMGMAQNKSTSALGGPIRSFLWCSRGYHGFGRDPDEKSREVVKTCQATNLSQSLFGVGFKHTRMFFSTAKNMSPSCCLNRWSMNGAVYNSTPRAGSRMVCTLKIKFVWVWIKILVLRW